MLHRDQTLETMTHSLLHCFSCLNINEVMYGVRGVSGCISLKDAFFGF